LQVNNKKIIKGNNISDEGCRVLNEILLKNENIEQLDIRGNFFKRK
jgi:hypothetical protein